jgi:hypothetical protein
MPTITTSGSFPGPMRLTVPTHPRCAQQSHSTSNSVNYLSSVTLTAWRLSEGVDWILCRRPVMRKLTGRGFVRISDGS